MPDLERPDVELNSTRAAQANAQGGSPERRPSSMANNTDGVVEGDASSWCPTDRSSRSDGSAALTLDCKMRTLLAPVWLLVWLFVLVLGQPSIAAAQLTEKQGDAIVNELRQIRQTLEKMQQQGAGSQAQARAAAPTTRAKVSTSGRPALGSDDAPVTVVEFADYQCPFCKSFFSTTLPTLKKEYIDTGKVRLVMKDLPLLMHSSARPAALAAQCATEQGKFWAMHDSLFTENGQPKDENFKRYAKDIGLDADRFDDCLRSNRYDATISAEVTEANGQGITGTPTFIVGPTTGDVVEGNILTGAQPIEAFRTQIDALLSQKAQAKKL
jgi:protein-disulfide isomerase